MKCMLRYIHKIQNIMICRKKDIDLIIGHNQVIPKDTFSVNQK